MNLFYQPAIQQGVHHLDPTESKHCTKVLRKKGGDKIYITDGKGFLYEALITRADPGECQFEIHETKAETEKSFSIHIAISATKHADRLEWFVEKAVELGVDRITIMMCEHTEHSHFKIDRLEKIAISAMKQSLRLKLPPVDGPIAFKDLVNEAEASSKFIAYVDAKNPEHLKKVAQPHSNYVVLVGPEGDFSRSEIELAMTKNFRKVSLGSNRLRTETAGLAACHILNLVNIA
ncbi:MAG TPA: 16S rRNA (uracil(1498)-N(3))-methyltransferase [Chryseolinea sp.]